MSSRSDVLCRIGSPCPSLVPENDSIKAFSPVKRGSPLQPLARLSPNTKMSPSFPHSDRSLQSLPLSPVLQGFVRGQSSDENVSECTEHSTLSWRAAGVI